jgi:hypothetical protein
MKEVMDYVNEEFNLFAERYCGSPMIDELIEMKANFNIWYSCKEQQIKDYYWTRHKDKKLSLLYNFKSIKLRITFIDNGELQISLDHSYSHLSNIADKHIKEYYFADPGYVYFIESKFGWKIGKTRDLNNRRKTFAVKLPFKFKLKYYIKSHDISKLEIFFHEYFKSRHVNGEWYLIKAEDIRDCIRNHPDLNLNLRMYHWDKDIKIEQNYLSEIDEIISVEESNNPLS